MPTDPVDITDAVAVPCVTVHPALLGEEVAGWGSDNQAEFLASFCRTLVAWAPSRRRMQCAYIRETLGDSGAERTVTEVLNELMPYDDPDALDPPLTLAQLPRACPDCRQLTGHTPTCPTRIADTLDALGGDD